MPLSRETVEYDRSARLLIIRNPTLAIQTEESILQRSGWTGLPQQEVNELLPPTPGTSKTGKTLSKQRPHQGGARTDGTGGARDEDCEDHRDEPSATAKDSQPASNNGPMLKRVYRPL